MVVLGNRGKCAQPCRLPYELISKDNSTGKEKILDNGFILSPRDLCGLDYIPFLINAGVKCFKIEGRMKNPEYVATVTRIYRKYIDLALSDDKYIVDDKDKKELMQVFNRGGFSSGHLDTEPNKDLIFKDKPNNMGLYLGNICNYNKSKGYVTLTLNEDLSIGDTISFKKEQSKYTVSELMIKNTNYTTCKAGQKVTIGRMKGNILIGDKVYKLESKELSTIAINSFKNVENKKIPLNCEVTIKKDTPISMKVYTKNGIKNELYQNINICNSSDVIPVEAIKTPISVERVIKQISKTTNTPYEFENITVYLDDGLYVPSISALNELRRNTLTDLENEIISRIKRKATNNKIEINKSLTKKELPKHPKISLYLRNLYKEYNYSKLDKEYINRLYLSLKLFVNKDYEEIITNLSQDYDIYVHMPKIIKANYKNIILNKIDNIIAKFNIKGFVLSNLSDFKFLEKYKGRYDFIGNYSLNVFNNFSLEEYHKLGLSTVTLSRELNINGLNEILNNTNIDTELVVYGKLPVMATNYCFLGKTNKCYPTCGLNCKKDASYYIKDRLRSKI